MEMMSGSPIKKQPALGNLLDFDSGSDEGNRRDDTAERELNGNATKSSSLNAIQDFTTKTHRASNAAKANIPAYTFNMQPLQPSPQQQTVVTPALNLPLIKSATIVGSRSAQHDTREAANVYSHRTLEPSKSTDQDTNMNEHISERFNQRKAVWETQKADADPHRIKVDLNLAIRQYFKSAVAYPPDPLRWTALPEIPSPSEVFDKGRHEHDEPIEIDGNIVAGPYPSAEEYLRRHYQLLREDAVAPLRDVVSEVQVSPYMMEADSENDSSIYERVYVTGFTFATTGIAARVTFSLKRVGKQVNWKQSKRLLTGSLVALTPANAIFKEVCHVCVVAARPLAGLEQNPPEIDLFFGGSDQIEIDPQQEWIMVQSRNGFFEGHRHVMQALQKLSQERFPMKDYIVDLKRDVEAPEYVKQQPLRDFRKLYTTSGEEAINVDILKGLPQLPCELDGSQLEALHRILAKRLAIVQGPPGTGKTHVSVLALKLMLENNEQSQPSPIIVAAQTNHAVDQLLRHVAQFEPNFIRLGGMTADMEVIKPRTLYEVKNAVKHSNPIGSKRGPALGRLNELTRELMSILAPLTLGKEQISSDVFLQYEIITRAQRESLLKGAQEWVSAKSQTEGDMATWLGENRVNAELRIAPEDYGIEFEEVDLEFEQLEEVEAESKLIDDEDFDTLRGRRLVLDEVWTGRKALRISDGIIQTELKKTDMWDIPSDLRGSVYRHMQKALKDVLGALFRAKAKNYAKAAQDAKIGRWESEISYLKQSPIIGMTTSGLSKNRGLLAALDPRVVLVEEAAETLESYASVACFRSLEHLVLVGDHQQLRGHCHDQGLAGKPFYLDVSLFERLVRNAVGFSRLKTQRRMIPEIRRNLRPIYDDLEDHPSVLQRAPVQGMGGINTFFFTHKWKESSDAQNSKANYQEAEMVVEFFNYLRLNGVEEDEITVLTFYNGQRKLILRKLRQHPNLQGSFKVVTIDSYQGEENGIVLLSLVRSNEQKKIGFLEVENRVCVALSRAQRGFYIFGDGLNLCKQSILWFEVMRIMFKDPRRVGFFFPLTCKNHSRATFINEAKDFLDGGCAEACGEMMACGHRCSFYCHPFPHEEVACQNPCQRTLECGHPCTKICSSECKSDCGCKSTTEEATTVSPLNYAKALTGSPQKKTRLPINAPPTSQPPVPKKILPKPLTGLPLTQPTPTPSLDILGIEGQAFRDFIQGDPIPSHQKAANPATEKNPGVLPHLLDRDEGEDLALNGRIENMKLVRTKADGREVWSGVYNPSGLEEEDGEGKGEKEKEKGGVGEEEVSLIEL